VGRRALNLKPASAVRVRAHPWLAAADGQRVGIDLVGCGGSGSLMLMRLVKIDTALKAFGHSGLLVRCYDPDTVTEANLGRQAFLPVDVGRNKARVLVDRVNAYFGLTWLAEPRRYDDSTLQCRMVVSCVDSHGARLSIERAIMARSFDGPRYWLDLGNTDRTGQVVLGEVSQADYRYRLPTVLELFGDRPPADDDTTPSCSS
jgi:PRTRC genetic system ThiF family protein